MSWWINIGDLDPEQQNVIALAKNGRYLLIGPPGSGKTNLLLIRAEYLIRSGSPNVHVLMFNRALHEFVVRGGSVYDVPADRIHKIITWQLKLLSEHGYEFESDEQDLLKWRKQLASRVLEMINENPALEGHVDTILVDEAQDCLEEEVQVVLKCARNVCFAGDNRQRIFSAKSQIDVLKDELEVVELTTHYRVGHSICQVADLVAKAAGLETIGSTCNYTGPIPSAAFLPCDSVDEQIEKILESVAVQLKAFPGELICVAAPRKVDVEKLEEAFAASGLSDKVLPHRVSGVDDESRQIYIAHLQEIKGLEFRAVHLAMMENVPKLGPNQRRITYTAITRAKTSLGIYFTGRIPPYLEEGRAAIEPPPKKPSLSELLPGGKGKLK